MIEHRELTMKRKLSMGCASVLEMRACDVRFKVDNESELASDHPDARGNQLQLG